MTRSDGVAIDSRVHAGKEKKSKALVLPALTVAVETATKARKRDPKCLKTASQRLLLATVLDALADGLSTQRQFKDALPKAERALKEYDAVAKAHLRAKNEDENFRARRAAAGCALAVASCRAALHKYDDAGDQFRDASNRYAGVSEFLAVWKSNCFSRGGGVTTLTDSRPLEPRRWRPDIDRVNCQAQRASTRID